MFFKFSLVKMLIFFCMILFYDCRISASETDITAVNFGAYDLKWSECEACRGPRSKNATDFKMVLVQQNNDVYGNLLLDVHTQCPIDEVKLWVYKLKGKTKSLLWVYKLADICKHFLFSEIIKKELKASNNCVIEKGIYNSSLNFSEITKKLMGQSFFYGDYLMKSLVTSKKANFMCVSIKVELSKPK